MSKWSELLRVLMKQFLLLIRPAEIISKENDWQSLSKRQLILEKNRNPFQELFMQQLTQKGAYDRFQKDFA